jgi:hypothetical protein
MTASPTEERVTKLPAGDKASLTPQRRYRRFRLCYPVTIRFEGETRGPELRALSDNISAAGILLETDSAIPQHCVVSFMITVLEHHIVGFIQIVGEGKVVRVEPRSSGPGYTVAVSCKHLLSKRAEFVPPFMSLD